METHERRIIFMHTNHQIICNLPFDAYAPGDIGKTKKMLAEEMYCAPEEIEVRIIGIRNGTRGRTVH